MTFDFGRFSHSSTHHLHSSYNHLQQPQLEYKVRHKFWFCIPGHYSSLLNLNIEFLLSSLTICVTRWSDDWQHKPCPAIRLKHRTSRWQSITQSCSCLVSESMENCTPLLTSPQGVGYCETPAVDPTFQAGGAQVPTESAGMAVGIDGSQTYAYGEI